MVNSSPTQKPKPFSPPAKLLPLTVSSLACTAVLYILAHHDNLVPNLLPVQLQDLLAHLLVPIVFTLSLLLLYRLLESIILHHGFRPTYIPSIIAIILPAPLLFFSIPEILIPIIISYAIISAIFFAFISFQKHHLATDSISAQPIYSPSSLLPISITIIILGLFALLSFIAYEDFITIPYQIIYFLFDLAGFFALPLQITLAILIFTKLPLVSRSTSLPRKIITYISLLLTLITIILFIIISGITVADFYGQRQPAPEIHYDN